MSVNKRNKQYSEMMRRLDNSGRIWYSIYAEANKLRGLFFLPFSLNTFIVNSAATLESPNLFASAAANKAKKRVRLFFVQSNRKAQVLVSPEPWKGLTCMSVKTVGMIAVLTAAVKKLSQMLSQYIPKESPGNSYASDSILLSLVRRDEPGLSSLFPPVAALIVASPLFGAASPGGDL